MTNRALVLLSGEQTTIPAAEAKALFLAYDPGSRFESPERRVLVAESRADPSRVAGRIAFARRVGVLIEEPSDASQLVRGKKVRVRTYSLKRRAAEAEPGSVLAGLDARVDLEAPDYEFSVVEGERRYIALTVPALMKQAWSLRRPRRRAFFHPSAIFPKLSRAMVNLTRCKEGELLLDPFCGTGSIPIEAAEEGLCGVALDQSIEMARGALANMKKFGQSWLGVVRADAFLPPLTQVDGVATDVPYGRASSTRGRAAANLVRLATEVLPSVMKSGSRLVLMHPQQAPVGPTPELDFEEEHNLYVHKRLTRTITILRRR